MTSNTDRGLALDEFAPLPFGFQLKYLPSVRGRWGRFGVGDDGSCFYHSIAAIVNYQGYHSQPRSQKIKIGRRLRQDVRACLSEEVWNAIVSEHGIQQHAPPFQKLQSEMLGFKTWANFWTILFTFHMLRLNVVFYDMSRGGQPYCGVTNVVPQKKRDPRSLAPQAAKLPNMNWSTCGICWIQHTHFEPICIDGTQFCWSSTSTIGRELIKKYEEQSVCPASRDAVLSAAAAHEADEFMQTSPFLRMNEYIELHTKLPDPFDVMWGDMRLFGGII